MKPWYAGISPFPLSKARIEKHLFFVFLAWWVTSVFAAAILPPSPSHVRPEWSLTIWSIVIMVSMLTIYTATILLIYFYQSWKELPTVANKTSYSVWLGFESLVFLAILIWIASVFFGRFIRP